MTPNPYNARVEKLRGAMVASGFDGFLVSHAANRRYLSGFTGSSGYLLISEKRALLATDSRYFEQVEVEAPDFELLSLKRYEPRWLVDAAASLCSQRLGFEAASLTHAEYRRFATEASKDGKGLQLVPTEGIVERVRVVKAPDEAEQIRLASVLVKSALKHVGGAMKSGMSERQVAWELEKFLREEGSGALPFEIMVASGPNSALPHAKPTERIISEREPVLIDLGATVCGYGCDFTRTMCLGEPDAMFRRVHDVVLGAQLTAMANIKAEMSGAQADLLARIVIQEAGYGEAFGHGLGHGVGLETHEIPRLGPSSEDALADGMVFTIEPGVYLSGWGGVRIEDTVLMESGRVRPLVGRH